MKPLPQAPAPLLICASTELQPNLDFPPRLAQTNPASLSGDSKTPPNLIAAPKPLKDTIKFDGPPQTKKTQDTPKLGFPPQKKRMEKRYKKTPQNETNLKTPLNLSAPPPPPQKKKKTKKPNIGAAQGAHRHPAGALAEQPLRRAELQRQGLASPSDPAEAAPGKQSRDGLLV